jgi:hypothetical protein
VNVRLRVHVNVSVSPWEGKYRSPSKRECDDVSPCDHLNVRS